MASGALLKAYRDEVPRMPFKKYKYIHLYF